MRSSFLTLALLIFAVAGCDSASDSESYTGFLFDPSGMSVFEADLRVGIPERGETVSGTYVLTAADESQRTGELQASTSSDGTLTLSLASGASDSGTNLVGTAAGDRIEGDWFELTIAGPRLAGSFELRRR